MDHSTGKELERIARLAGLTLSEEEKDILFTDLSRIVPYMERVAELGPGERIGSEDSDMTMTLREDEECVSGISEKIVEQAPLARDGMFTVPRTVE